MRAFKTYYISKMRWNLIDLTDKTLKCQSSSVTSNSTFVKKINVLEALNLTNEPWNVISGATTWNWFWHGVFAKTDKHWKRKKTAVLLRHQKTLLSATRRPGWMSTTIFKLLMRILSASSVSLLSQKPSVARRMQETMMILKKLMESKFHPTNQGELPALGDQCRRLLGL